ncbi:putative gamma-butyrolactone biosynthesis enzyme [Gordonia polyisoprenivorans NBRC 16320 = JCM 10675]|uniref:A-factor biosynthesis hotdog domain-containing protein n=1 Tax=Gordonia polyisoprenivorans TaxID=84595 RepID=A0A846WNB5_9ACTN|nr:AfsA-related hotdog domain-containing protein [Gordonia polyisoprenivorans]NKY03085.1 hypothetical protein [Gordonia polyisoprenivorans]GAB22235.1 putative gamma-butyrolactone biosynthesis enzyme [Gordonia polyisoprenivorans NBRC 16320 = JCM 10675]
MTYTLQPQLSHSTLVPREHVHRDALSEVYLTDIICDRYPNFRIGVHLPKSHSYYSDHIGPAEFRYDPLLILECFRQTSILIAHRHVGAGFDQAFIFNDADIQVVSHEATTITFTLEYVRGGRLGRSSAVRGVARQSPVCPRWLGVEGHPGP